MINRKKIIFVNPPLSLQQRYGILFQAGAVEPPLGIAYLASVVRRMGFDVKIIDAAALLLDINETADIIMREDPDFLAITLVTVAVALAAKLAEVIKEKKPAVKIIIGGCHFSSLPQETLRENISFDVGVRGEGENIIGALLEALVNNLPLHEVSGIAFRDGNEIVLTPPVQRISNLDDLPFPAFDLLPELKRYYRTTTQSIKHLPTISLVTSRGCAGQCIFCDRTIFGNEVRMHSAEYVTDMMLKLQKDFGIKGVIFEEDNFMLSQKRLEDLRCLYKKKKIKICWSALSRVDTINEEKIKIAKNCGCWQILYGIESGSQKILDFLKKGITVEQIREAVCLTKKHGLYVKGLFIVGNPQETVGTLQETRNLINSLPLDDISLTYFTPYPGAEIWRRIHEFGRFDNDREKLNCFEMVFVPRGILRNEVMAMQKSILKEFYSSVRVLWSYIKRLRSFSQCKELYKSWKGISLYTKTEKDYKKLIITIDDVGLCEGINKGVVSLLRNGSKVNVSVMPTGYAFKSAVDIAKDNPETSVGIHLSLIETKPVLPINEIPSLINKSGRFESKFYIFLLRYLFGRIRKEHIVKELNAQILKMQDAGVSVLLINSHQHMHMLPGIFRIVAMLAKKHGIHSIRLPCVPFDSRCFFSKAPMHRKFMQLVFNIISKVYKIILTNNGLNFYDFSFGFLESGHLTKEKVFSVVSSLGRGKNELIAHPAYENEELLRLIGVWGYEWQKELDVLKGVNLIKNL